MILLTLIKKELKDFFRSKSDVIIMLIFPVILIFVMGKSLNNLMSVEKNIFNNKTIYYKINAPINNEKSSFVFISPFTVKRKLAGPIETIFPKL